MLIRSNERLFPTSINMITLQGDDGTYYYVHNSLYKQIVILDDVYRDSQDELVKQIGNEVENKEALNLFLTTVPKPLDLLGYFLALVKDSKSIPEDVDVMCGIIHVITSSIDLRKLVKVNKEFRAGITFSLSIQDEYSIAWDRFFQEAIPFSIIQNTIQGNYNNNISTPAIDETDINYDNLETVEDFDNAFNASDFDFSVSDEEVAETMDKNKTMTQDQPEEQFDPEIDQDENDEILKKLLAMATE